MINNKTGVTGQISKCYVMLTVGMFSGPVLSLVVVVVSGL